jgi:hypothetical protein
MLQSPGDEFMTVSTLAPDGHKQLARVELTGIGGASGNFPVMTPDELGLGEQPSEADRGNRSLLRGTIEKPSGHRRSLLAGLGRARTILEPSAQTDFWPKTQKRQSQTRKLADNSLLLQDEVRDGLESWP